MTVLSSASPMAIARAAVLAAGLFVTAGAAVASPIEVRDGNGGTVFNGGPGYVSLTINVDGNAIGVAAGAFALEYRTSPASGWIGFLTYCLEPNEALGIDGNGTPVSGTLIDSLAQAPDYAGRATALAGLWNSWYGDSLTSATRSAAFQVALWEVAYDAGSNLAAGIFRYTASGAVLSQADAYLDPTGWNNPVGSPPGGIVRIGHQDLVVTIPEPASLALLGLGLIGLAAATRRRSASA